MSYVSVDTQPFPRSTPFRVDRWRVEPELNAVTTNDRMRRLGPILMTLWVVLARRRGRLVTKEELIREVWQGRYVSDDAVTVAIYELRKLLGDSARKPRYIETIPGKGYRWLVDVDWEPAAIEERAPESESPWTDRLSSDGTSEPLGDAFEQSMATGIGRRGWLAAGTVMIGWVVVGILIWNLPGDKTHLREGKGSASRLGSPSQMAPGEGVAAAFHGASSLVPMSREEAIHALEVSPRQGDSREAAAWQSCTASEGLEIPLDERLSLGVYGSHSSDSEPLHPGALYVAGLATMLRPEEWQSRLQHFEDSVTTDPEDAQAWQGLAWILLSRGDLGRAEEAAERSAELTPRSPDALHLEVFVALARGHSSEALRILNRAEEQGIPMNHHILGLKVTILMELGSPDQAWPTYLQALAAAGYEEVYLRRLQALHQERGFEGVLRHRLQTIPEMPRSWQALHWMWLGEKEEALRSLEEGVLLGQPEMMLVSVHPGFRNLHGLPAFESLVDR